MKIKLIALAILALILCSGCIYDNEMKGTTESRLVAVREEGSEVIFRDRKTNIMYLNKCRKTIDNGISVLYNKDRQPMTYEEYMKESRVSDDKRY